VNTDDAGGDNNDGDELSPAIYGTLIESAIRCKRAAVLVHTHARAHVLFCTIE
jgi:hypothetical protein